MTFFNRIRALWQQAVADMDQAPLYPLTTDEWETMQRHANEQVALKRLQQDLNLQRDGTRWVVPAR